MYKILFGIPAAPFERFCNTENGCIEDYEVAEDNDPWCDFSLEYNMKENYYYYSFETMLGFGTKDGCRDWIITCLAKLTSYMEKHGCDTTKELNMYEVFTAGVNVNTHFETIEDAYAWLKMIVFGFHGNALFLEEETENDRARY